MRLANLVNQKIQSLIWLALGFVSAWEAAVASYLYWGFPSGLVGLLVFYLMVAWDLRKWEGFMFRLPFYVVGGAFLAALLVPGIGCPSLYPATLSRLLSLSGPFYQLNYVMLAAAACACWLVLFSPMIENDRA